MPPEPRNWPWPVYHLLVVGTSRREALESYLADKDIGTAIHDPAALRKLAAYAYLERGAEDSFVVRADSSRSSLPVGEHPSGVELEAIVSAVREFFS